MTNKDTKQGVGSSFANGVVSGAKQSVTQPLKPAKRLRVPTTEEVSAGGRVAREAAAGAATGATIGKRIPRVGAMAGGAVGGVIGAGRGLVKEADRVNEKKAQRENTVPESGANHGPVNSQAGLAAVRVGRAMSQPQQGPVSTSAAGLTGYQMPNGQQIWMGADRLAKKGAPEAGVPLIDSVPGVNSSTQPRHKSKIDMGALISRVPGQDELVAKREAAKVKAADYGSGIPSQTPEADGAAPRQPDEDAGMSM